MNGFKGILLVLKFKKKNRTFTKVEKVILTFPLIYACLAQSDNLVLWPARRSCDPSLPTTWDSAWAKGLAASRPEEAF